MEFTITNLIPLPTDITNLILEFTGYHKFRKGFINGRFMKQLVLTSKRITKFHKRFLARPKMRNGYVVLHFSDEVRIVLFPQTYNIPSGHNNRL